MAQRQAATGRALALSILLHAALVVMALAAWWQWRDDPVPATLAIEAAVVDARELDGLPPSRPAPVVAEPEPAQVPEPAPVEPPPPAEPDRSAELLAEQREAERQQQVAAERLEDERRAREAEQAQREAEAKRAAEVKRQAEAKRQADAKQAADAKRRAEEQRLAAEKLAKEKAAAAAARQQDERESELRGGLAAEERGAAIRSGPAADLWKAQIRARIERAWIRPPSARLGVECDVSVTQVPGGEVTSVRVESCTGGDDALRSSVETAVYRASPLPLPPDPSLFERNLRLTFRPND